MNIEIFQVDAFAQQVFEGNPAAVCPLDYWLEDQLLQQIAQANNLSETAFFVPFEDKFQLRWFTPSHEVDLCGHATLAAAHVLFTHLNYSQSSILFCSKSGELEVTKTALGLQMDFPASPVKPITAPKALLIGLGVKPKAVLAGLDYVVELHNEEAVMALSPDFMPWLNLDLRGVVVTAASCKYDFVSRCFFPKLAVNEDPVTGSAHCQLAPFWGKRLGKSDLLAKQGVTTPSSARSGETRSGETRSCVTRSGIIACSVTHSRVFISGTVVDYMRGKITL